MSMMRTQALPKCWTTSGRTRRPIAATAKTRSLFAGAFMTALLLGAVGDTLAEQSLRAQRQHEDEHDEGEDILVVAAEDAAREGADVAGAHRLDEAEQHAPDHRPGEI